MADDLPLVAHESAGGNTDARSLRRDRLADAVEHVSQPEEEHTHQRGTHVFWKVRANTSRNCTPLSSSAVMDNTTPQKVIQFTAQMLVRYSNSSPPAHNNRAECSFCAALTRLISWTEPMLMNAFNSSIRTYGRPGTHPVGLNGGIDGLTAILQVLDLI